MSQPNLGGSGPDPRRKTRVVRVLRPAGSRFVRWAFAILLVLVALAVLAIWQGAQLLQHVAQTTGTMSREMGQQSQVVDRYLQQIDYALQGIGQALARLVHAIRP